MLPIVAYMGNYRGAVSPALLSLESVANLELVGTEVFRAQLVDA